MIKTRKFDKKKDLEAMTEILHIFREENRIKKLSFPKEYVDIKFYKENVFNIHDIVIAQDNGKISGFATMYPKNGKPYETYFLNIIYVEPKSRTKDIGLKLMQHVIREAKYKGYERIQSKVNKLNEKPVNLHKKCGFYPASYPKDQYFYLMTKTLR